MMKYKLLVDINPLGVDLELIDENNQAQHLHVPFDDQGFAVQGLTQDDFVKAIKAGFEILESHLQDSDTIEHIEFTDIMNGWMALDETFKPLTPILMGDSQDEHFIEALMMNGIGGQLQRKTGVPLAVTLPLIITLRLKNNEPEIYKNTAHYMTLRAYIVYMLFGTNTATPAFAARTGFYNSEQMGWDTQALALTGVQPEQLPILVSDQALVGDLKATWLPKMINHKTVFKMH